MTFIWINTPCWHPFDCSWQVENVKLVALGNITLEETLAGI